MSPEPEIPLAAVEPLALEAAPGSSSPHLTVGPDGTVYAVWIDPVEEDRHALRLATYAPGDTAWSIPRTIASGARWFVNWADVPSLAVGADGVLVAHWLVYNGTERYAYGVRVSRSADGGATWSAPVWLHEDDSPTEHGFVSMVPVAGGGMRVVWLDGRLFARGDRTMTLRGRLLHADGSFGPEALLDERVCECCPTAAVSLDDGAVLVVYRNRTGEEMRDIWRVRFDGTAWGSPAPVHEDGWEITGCPVNGPAVAARGKQVVVAWFTAAGEVPHVKAAFSEDGGKTFGPPVLLDQGQPTGRVDAVLLDDGTAFVSWIEGKSAGEEAGLYARRVTPDGRTSEAVLLMPSTTSRAGGYPRMVHAGQELVFAWTEPGTPGRVRSARARLGN